MNYFRDRICLDGPVTKVQKALFMCWIPHIATQDRHSSTSVNISNSISSRTVLYFFSFSSIPCLIHCSFVLRYLLNFLASLANASKSTFLGVSLPFCTAGRDAIRACQALRCWNSLISTPPKSVHECGKHQCQARSISSFNQICTYLQSSPMKS